MIAVADGPKRFPEATGATFPETLIQTCIVHPIGNSLAFFLWTDRKPIMCDPKAIYRAYRRGLSVVKQKENIITAEHVADRGRGDAGWIFSAFSLMAAAPRG